MVTQSIKNKVNTSYLIELCILNKLGFVIYRQPMQSTSYILISYNKIPVQKTIEFEDLASGFIVAPYDAKHHLPYFLSADIIVEIDTLDIVTLDEFQLSRLNIDNQETSRNIKPFTLIDADNLSEQAKEIYINNVQKAKQQIITGNCQKVVLSRKKFLGTLNNKNYYEGFKNLERSYPSAFVSIVYLPWKNQIWMGATPETLISQTADGMFKTVALAGTQTAIDSNGNEILPSDALWSQKEIEEQALVSRYIINCLKKIRVREYIEEGPKTIKAGNLLHLNSSYSINSKEINFRNLSTIMLDLLHPTPAVCGMPKQQASEIIEQTESYDREFYSGYLGPVNINNSSHLFVNLRTMKIENNEVFAYAGGGITIDSIPEKEWLETELKLKTITQAFN